MELMARSLPTFFTLIISILLFDYVKAKVNNTKIEHTKIKIKKTNGSVLMFFIFTVIFTEVISALYTYFSKTDTSLMAGATPIEVIIETTTIGVVSGLIIAFVVYFCPLAKRRKIKKHKRKVKNEIFR